LGMGPLNRPMNTQGKVLLVYFLFIKMRWQRMV
jgi:hypothetical protein